MLAAFKDYLFPWQLPFLLVFIVGWLFGGGYLLYRSLINSGEAKRVKLGRCILAAMLAGSAGAIAGGIMVFFANTFLGGDRPMQIIAALFGLTTAAVMAYLTLYATFSLSFRKTLKVSILPMVGVGLLAIALAVAVGIPSCMMRRRNLIKKIERAHLQKIHSAISLYYRNHLRVAPPNLKTLMDAGYIEPKFFRCTAMPDKEIGYFYFAPAYPPERGKEYRLLACELRGSSSEGGRHVLTAASTVEWMTDSQFQNELNKPINSEFAAALRAAEGS